jgi:tetratricopeptide (TPR) repeat protein
MAIGFSLCFPLLLLGETNTTSPKPDRSKPKDANQANSASNSLPDTRPSTKPTSASDKPKAKGDAAKQGQDELDTGSSSRPSMKAERSVQAERQWLQRGLAALQAGRMEEADDIAKELRREGEKRPEMLYFLGLVDLATGRYESAERLFQQVIELRPQLHRARLDLARAMLGRKNYAWAIRTLQPLVNQLQGHEGVVYYYLGYALLQLGEFQDAEEMLRLALNSPSIGALRERCVLFLGEVELRQGRRNAAFNRFLSIHRSNMWSENNTDTILREMLIAEGRNEPWLDVFGSAGFGFHSNPIMASINANDSAPSGMYQLTAGLKLTPLRKNWLMDGHFMIHRTGYLSPHPDANNFNLTSFSAAVDLRHRLNFWTLLHLIHLEYAFTLDWLDGGPRVDDPNFYLFQEAHIGRFRWSFGRLESWTVTLAYVIAGRFFRDRGRTAQGHEWIIRAIGFLGRFNLEAQAGLRLEYARGPGYDLFVPFGQVRLQYQLPPRWLFHIGAAYGRDSYYQAFRYPDYFGGQRHDNSIRAFAGVSFAINPGFLDLDARYTANLSNVQTYDYRSLVIGLSYTYRFTL